VRGAAAGNADGIDGSLGFVVRGLRAEDAGLAAALGRELSGKVAFDWRQDGPFEVRSFRIAGAGAEAEGAFTSVLGDQGPEISGQAKARMDDVSRLSLLAGRPLVGAAAASVSGRLMPISGAFDASAELTGRDLMVGIVELDRLFRGQSVTRLDLRRDETGVTIRHADLRAGGFTATLSGKLATGRADLEGNVAFGDLSVLGPGYRGSLTAAADIARSDGGTRIKLSGQTKGLGVGSAGIDPLLTGDGSLDATLQLPDGQLPRIETLFLRTEQVSMTAEAAEGSADGRLDLSATLRDLAVVVPGFPGPVTAKGRATPDTEGTTVDLRLTGPGQITAVLNGRIAADGKNAALSAQGTAQAAMLNPFIAPRNVAGPVGFDLRLDGPLAMTSVTGSVRLSGGRLAAPEAGLAVTGIDAEARLSEGRASLSGTGSVQDGGSISLSGESGLAAPFPVDTTLTLAAARLRNPDLFDTRVSGRLVIGGSLLGGGLRAAGDLALSETEIRVPSTGLGYATFTGDIVHLRDGAPVRETRRRAGFDKGETAVGGGRPVALDILISAPNRIFVRGRGLDAEFGGSLRIGGTSDDIMPSGGFTMIRGRLDLLGKRFAISDGQLLLQGALVPTVHFEATTTNDGVTATVVVDGPASQPTVSFTSSPTLPQEEIVARLLFGKGLQSLSPFQAAQLASAVASLAGKGGEGIVGRLRQSFGLDDLDVTGAGDGTFALKIGKYISDNVYTNVEVDGQGKTAINLNLDIPPGVTLRGSLATDGTSSLGAFVERDY
jgi:translocation and assembly module TamB